jgi:DNA helicase II / ATP-dependent DNA helicase PcrA
MGRYEQALAGLNSAQKQAVETIDGPVLVIAGPGTGKTQLLTTRIAHILAVTDTLPQNILCLTFTDSAAQTMRERLSNLIGQAAYNVTISTYHAFGSELIRRFPDYSIESKELHPADDLTIDRIFQGIIASLPYSNPLKHADAYLRDIKSLISDAKRALLTPRHLRQIAQENLAFIEESNPLVREVLDGLIRVDKKSTALFNNLLAAVERTARKLSETHPSQSGAGEPASGAQPLGKQLVQSLKEAIEQAQTSGKTTPLTAWKNTWLAKDQTGQFIIDGTKTNQKILAAAGVYEHYLEELKVRGLFDYDDMILRAIQALQTNAELRFSLQEQYLYILLDEFQDTNGAQLRLVELLTDNPVHEGRPNVLAVGDDDQAIYAFQGANYSHMLQFTTMYRDVTVIPLTKNYRSHAAILHTAQGLAEQIEERLHHHFPKINKVLTAENDHLPKHAIVERREAQSDVMHYGWITRQVENLIEQGTPPSEIAILAPQHKYLKPLVPFLQQEKIPLRYEKRENVLDDPAVNQLLRMSELVLALSRGEQTMANSLWPQILSFGFWNLPTSRIWQLSWQVADDNRDWTAELLVDMPLKPIALFFLRLSQLAGTETLETMMDYLIGSQPLDLHEPGYDNFTSPYYEYYFGNPSMDERAGSAISEEAAMEQMRGGRHGGIPKARHELSTLGKGLPDRTPHASEGLRTDFWNLLTNLIVLRARLRDYRKNGEDRLLLEDLIEFAQAHQAAELKILNTSPYASSTNAVQLMTAHKAKGMEFTAVFLLAATDEAWGTKARGQTTRVGLPPNLQHIRHSGTTNDERLRLLYVAITRAKSQLYLVNYSQNYAGKTFTRLKYLNENSDEQGKVHSPLLPPGKQAVATAEDGVPAPTTELAAYWHRRHEQALTTADMQTLLHDRVRQFQLSPTHINDFIDLAHCGPQHFFMRTILRFPEAPRPGMQYGNAIHETLEWVIAHLTQTGKLPSRTATLEAFSKRLQAKGLNPHDEILFLERGQLALGRFLAQRASSMAPTDRAEYNFRHEGVFVGQAHLTGSIDRLIIDRAAKTITIVDYKTGKSHKRWTRDIALHKYRQQLYMYWALVEGSHTFAGYQVVDAYLEFVEPDEDGLINQLHLSFDKAEYQRVKQLAQAIWQRITTFNLPDTSSYNADLNGIEAFEQNLLNE